MAHTGKYIVRRRDETYNLTWMDKDELKILLDTLKLDVADINNQIEIEIENGDTRGSLWKKSAIAAARIKLNDIKKINRVLEEKAGIPASKQVDLTKIDLGRILTEVMKDNIPNEIIEMVIERVYKEIYK